MKQTAGLPSHGAVVPAVLAPSRNLTSASFSSFKLGLEIGKGRL